MHRSVFISVLFVIIALVSSASAQSPQQWQTMSSTNGRFEAAFPFAPSTSSTTQATPNGKLINNMVSAETNDSVFIVSFADSLSNIKDAPSALLESQSNVVRDMKATLLVSRSTTVKGHPALVYRVKMPQPSGEVLIGSVMVLFVGQRLYQVIAVQPEEKASNDEAAKFISSFRLVG